MQGERSAVARKAAITVDGHAVQIKKFMHRARVNARPPGWGGLENRPKKTGRRFGRCGASLLEGMLGCFPITIRGRGRERFILPKQTGLFGRIQTISER